MNQTAPRLGGDNREHELNGADARRPPPEGHRHSRGLLKEPERSETNSRTLRSYEVGLDAYIDKTPATVAGVSKAWIDAILSDLSVEAKLVELGSACGRDAAYIASKGFAIECTDAVPGFLSLLLAKGLAARPFNALTDELNESYDLIFAHGVLLHFDRNEFSFVMSKLRRSLKSGGRLAFSLKIGKGESWSTEKIGAPRFFCYWERESLENRLATARFDSWAIEEVSGQHSEAEWLFVTARAP